MNTPEEGWGARDTVVEGAPGIKPPIKVWQPLDKQVGGSHYKEYAIQPIEFAMANKLEYCEANAIKYITRHQDKSGAEDIRKAIHNLEIILQLKYGEDDLG